MTLIHIASWNFYVVAFYHTSRNTDNGAVWRNFLQNHASGSDLGIFPDRKRTDDFCAGTDHDIVADRWMTLSGLFSGSA